MKPPLHDASARQHSGEPSSGLGPVDIRKDRLRNPDLASLDGEIAGLVDRSTQELRRAWRTLHHTGPPLGLSRDLMIRTFCQQTARARPWRSQPRAAAAPAEPGWRVGERRCFLRSRHRAEDRCDLGAAMAGAHPYRSRARGRVRIRWPAVSVADGDCRADYRSALVGPAFLWPLQANASILVAEASP